jgi:4-hydroxyphenylpyruvate dioxygenase
MSLGRAWVHEMPEKMKQAAEAGFQGIEIFYEDLEYLAKKYGDNTKDENILAAAKEVRELCDGLGLDIFGLQPFLFYEGLVDRQEHERKIVKLKLWFRIVKVLGTNTIQIPTNFQQGGTSGDIDLITQDLIEVADLGIKEDPPVRFAYENIAWGTHIDTWEGIWDIVQRVNRPNFGCCLDTFNIAGRVWADPASPTGKTASAEKDFQASMELLRNTIDISKVYYVQVVDAERMEQPLVEGHPFHVDGQPPRMSWSRNARLFAYETDRGAYLPSVEVAKVLLNDLKFEGWVSMELFSRTLADPEPTGPREHAQRGIASWKRLQSDLRL